MYICMYVYICIYIYISFLLSWSCATGSATTGSTSSQTDQSAAPICKCGMSVWASSSERQTTHLKIGAFVLSHMTLSPTNISCGDFFCTGTAKSQERQQQKHKAHDLLPSLSLLGVLGHAFCAAWSKWYGLKGFPFFHLVLKMYVTQKNIANLVLTNWWGFLGLPLFCQWSQCFCTLREMCCKYC